MDRTKWEYRKLEEVCEIEYGKRVVQQRDGGSIYPVYGGGDATFRMDSYNRENRVVVSRFAMSAKCTRKVNGKFFLNDSGLTLKATFPTLLQTYLDSCVLALNDKIYLLGRGVAQKNLKVDELLKVIIPIPQQVQQLAIVAELDKLNELIALKRKQLADLDSLAQSLFYEMFGDPVVNEKGWETKLLGEVAEPTIGLTYKPQNVKEDGTGIIVLRSCNIQESELDFDDIVRVDLPIKDDKYVREGDILMCSRNGSFKLVGKVAMIPYLEQRMSYGAFMTVIRSKNNPYLFSYFKTQAFRNCLIQGKTTTVNQVTVKMLRDICIPLPPLLLQQSFASKIAKIEAEKQRVKSSLKDLETLLASRMQYWFDS